MKIYKALVGLAVSLVACSSAFAGSATTTVQLSNMSQHNASYFYYITQTNGKSDTVPPNMQLGNPLTLTTNSSDDCKHASYNITVTSSTAENNAQSPAIALCGFVADIKTCQEGTGPDMAVKNISTDSSSSDGGMTVSGSVESGTLINNKPSFPGSNSTDVCSVGFQKGSSSDKQTMLIKVTTGS